MLVALRGVIEALGLEETVGSALVALGVGLLLLSGEVEAVLDAASTRVRIGAAETLLGEPHFARADSLGRGRACRETEDGTHYQEPSHPTRKETMKRLAMLLLVSVASCANVQSADTAVDAGVDTGVDCSRAGCSPPPACGETCKAVCGCCPNTTCGDSGAKSTAIAGTIDGKPVDAAIAALWIGTPDDPSTTVLYVFSKPVDCATISKTGWDARLPAGAQFFEIVAGDTVAASYEVVSAAPGNRQALATFSYASSGSTGPTEKPGAAGKVDLTSITPKSRALGTFDVTVSGGTLKGSFDAAYCAAGREP